MFFKKKVPFQEYCTASLDATFEHTDEAIHSAGFRDIALRLLKEHRREKQFQIPTLNIMTAYELEARGCKVVFNYSKQGLDMVSSPVPFGKLVTKAEWREDRSAIDPALRVVIIIGAIFGIALGVVVGRSQGLLAGALWVVVCTISGVFIVLNLGAALEALAGFLWELFTCFRGRPADKRPDKRHSTQNESTK